MSTPSMVAVAGAVVAIAGAGYLLLMALGFAIVSAVRTSYYAEAVRLPVPKATMEALDAARGRGDPAAAAALDEIDGSREEGTMLERVRMRARENPTGACAALLEAAAAYPPWVDFAAMRPAGALYERYLPVIGLALGCGSLVASYTAERGNKVLIRTGRLTSSPKAVDRRLSETFSFLHAVSLRPHEALRPGGAGADAALAVRLLHERVRRHCLRGQGWPARELGVPVNQEDMLGTLLVFSTVVAKALRLLGAWVSEEEEEALNQVWRCTGWLMGVEEALLRGRMASAAAASRLNAAILVRNCRVDDAARSLVAALLLGMTEGRKAWGKPPLPLHLVHAASRHILGPELAGELGLQRQVRGRAALCALVGAVRCVAVAAAFVPGVERCLARRSAVFAARSRPKEGDRGFSFRTNEGD